MHTDQLISTFVEYYEERGHRRITGSTLLPPDGDPVLFTTSGMHPLTPYLEVRPHPLGRRLVNVQRCLRTTDLDGVGDATHLTVFDMLGTWSLGDYGGPLSLDWGCGLLTEGLGIDPGLLHATAPPLPHRPPARGRHESAPPHRDTGRRPRYRGIHRRSPRQLKVP